MTENITESLTVDEKKNNLPKFSILYVVFMVVILGLAHVLDEYTSIAPTYIKSSLVIDFFLENGIDETTALQTMNNMMFIQVILMFFSNFFKGLQDKWGRKPIFIISIIGMTLGVFIQSISPNYAIFMVGSSIGGFFLFNDMQYVYINEETPTKWRAQAFTTAKIIGLAAIFLIPFIRDKYITDTDPNWQPVLYFPIIVGVIVLIFGSIFLKETRAFQLVKDDRKNNPEKYKKEKINLRNAVKDLKKIPTWNQVKWIIIIMLVASPFYLVNVTYSEFMMYELNYLQKDVNMVLKLSVIGTGVVYVIQGQITDRIGRKFSYIMNTVLVLVLVPIEYYALFNNWIIVIGITQGIRIGAFWNITDVNRFMLIENVPTRLRGYAQTYSGLIMFISIPFSIVATTILLGLVNYTYDLFFLFGLPFILVSLILIIWKLKETKNVDLTKIEG